MSKTTFSQSTADFGYLRNGRAWLSNDDMMTVQVSRNKDRIEVARYGEMVNCAIAVTAEQARALAAELIACAAATEAANLGGKQ